jgi:4'-phosphopantetheinyl transferase EntD
MRRIRYQYVSGLIFAVIAILQAVRAIGAVPVHVGDLAVPVWPSWIIVVAASALSTWAFRSRG